MDKIKLDDKEILKRVRQMLKDEGEGQSSKPDDEQLVIEYLLPALEEMKEIQSALYEPFYTTDVGAVKKLKNSVIRKLANVTRNTVEMSLMRQQKFNDNISLIIEYLVRENKKLKDEIKSLKKD